MVGQSSSKHLPPHTHTNSKVTTHIFLDGVGVLDPHHPLTHQHCLLLVAECLEREGTTLRCSLPLT